MNKIISPVDLNMDGFDVVNLQDALLLLIERGELKPPDEEHAKLLRGLKSERKKSSYGKTTAKLVALFRVKSGLGDGQDVDEKTAQALNEALGKLGVLEADPQDVSPAAPPLSEWDRIDQAVSPFLAEHGEAGEPLHPSRLSYNDMEALARDAGVDIDQIQQWAQTFEMAENTQLLGADPQANAQEAAVYYGWFRLGLPTSYDAFMKLPTDELMKAFIGAVDQNIIAPSMRALEATLREALVNRLIDNKLRPADEGHPATLGNVLMTMPTPLSDAHQRIVASVVNEVTVDDEQFAARLNAAGLDTPQIAAVERTLRLGELAGQNLPLVESLQEVTAADAQGNLVGLASLSPTDWINRAFEFGVPAEIGGSPVDYALKLQHEVEDLHPTATLKARLEQNRLNAALPGKEQALSFLRDHPDFDIVQTNLDVYLVESDVPEAAELRKALVPMQRLKRLSASWDEADLLYNAGVRSSASVLDAGVKGISDALVGEQRQLRAANLYEKARNARDTALATLVRITPRFNNSGVTVLPNPGGNIDQSLLQEFPSLRQLFGDLDECACDPCLSVLSPAAYYVDLLQFLKHTGSETGINPAFAALMKRRPDLVDLELSCENTKTEMPVIDLALEILENTVALPLTLLFEPGTDVVSMLTTPGLETSIREIIQSTTVLPLSETMTAVRIDSGDWGANWSLTDKDRRWTLRQQEEGFTFGRFTMNNAIEEIRLATNPAEHAQMLDALSRLNFPNQIEAAIASHPDIIENEVGSYIPDITTYRVDVNQDARLWLITQVRAIRVTILWRRADGGRIAIESLSGQMLDDASYYDSQPYSVAYRLDIVAQGGVPIGAFAQSLDSYFGKISNGMSDLHVTIETPADGDLLGVWRIEGEGLFQLKFYIDQLAITALTYQSSHAESEPVNEPEYRNPVAYTALAQATFPWTLPLHLPLEETRRFLERAGVTRQRLMELMTAADPWSERRLNSGAVAHEVLGITSSEAALLTTPVSAPEIWKHWGFRLDPSGQASIYDSFSGEDLTEPPFDLVRHLSILLQQSRLSFDDLQAVLHTQFVSSGYEVPIISEDECKPSRTVVGLLQHHPDRIHRFVRLQRRLGWTFPELDQAIQAVQRFGTDVSPNLIALSHLKRLHSRLGLSIEVVASWWLERAATGLYERIFLNPSIQKPPHPAFRLSADRLALENENITVRITGELLRLVAASLGTRTSSIDQLLAYARETAPRPNVLDVTNLLTLRNLLRLYREVTLCRALGVSASDYIRLRRISGIDPFLRPDSCLMFCDLVDLIHDSGFDIRGLAYLLLHETDESVPHILTTRHQDAILDELITGVRALRSQIQAANSANTETPQDEAELLIDQVISHLAVSIDLDEATARDLLTHRLGYQKLPTAPHVAAISAFTDPDLLNDLQGEPGQKAQLAASNLLVRLHKCALLLNQFDLRMPYLAWIEAGDDHRGLLGLDFNELPVTAQTSSSPRLFTGWRRLVLIHAIARSVPGAETFLRGYLAAVTDASLEPYARISKAVEKIALAFGVSADDISQVAANRLLMSTVEHFLDPVQLAGLFELADLMRRLGVSESEAHQLSNADVPASTSLLARKILHTKFGPQAHKIIKPIMDVLRTRQRDALVDHLLNREKLNDANQLYEYFLIDPQSSPRLKTTRLLQATQSVQLFIHRCLLNLEPNIELTAVQRQRWEWMKNYRVWEANRKVFLFPENWLYPELREDKTAVFRELEGSLAQTEIDPEAAITAANKFVRSLGDVARVRVLGMYHDIQRESLYVVGRTPNEPGQYVWRECLQFGKPGMRWTGWEPIELNVSGDHLMPFVLDGKPAIAWPSFKKNTDQQPDLWEISLNWSKRADAGWGKPAMIDNLLRNAPVRVIPGKDEASTFSFRISERSVPSSISFVSGNSAPLKTVDIECYVPNDPIRPPTDPNSFFIIASPLSVTPAERTFDSLPIDGKVRVTLYFQAWIVDGQVGTISVAYEPFKALTIGWNALAAASVLASGAFTTDALGRAYPIIEIPEPSTEEALVLFATQYRGNTYSATVKITQFNVSTNNKRYAALYSVRLGFYYFSRNPPQPRPPITFDQNLSMEQRVIVSIPTSGTANLREGDASLKLPSLDGAYHWGNGYREQTNFSLTDGRLRMPGDASSTLLTTTPGLFEVITDMKVLNPEKILWYRDDKASYLRMTAIWNGVSYPRLLTEGALPFREIASWAASDFTHIRNIDNQRISDEGRLLTQRQIGLPLSPDSNTMEKFHFLDAAIPFAIYNWELFFHVPWLIADHLSKQQRFDEAQRWLHFIFDPTTDEQPNPDHPHWHYWKFLPFRENEHPESISELLEQLANRGVTSDAKRQFKASVDMWKDHPFRPHAIARMRISAYQWRTLFTYLDNLIAWGDQQFARDTRESINEATQLYVLAANLLGRRPRTLNRQRSYTVHTYRSLAGSLDTDFSNAWLPLADHVQENSDPPPSTPPANGTDVLNSLSYLYFCVPFNDKLTEYWDRIEDRLSKIRNSRNIDGIARELPLFDPPIDPELLVRAVAAGLDIGEVLAQREAPLPKYRFMTLAQKATELCSEVKSLGGMLLSAMEKRDAEHLALLRAGHELDLLRLVQSVRQAQVDEAKANAIAQRQNRTSVDQRYEHFQLLLDRPGVKAPEEGKVITLENVAPQTVRSSNLRAEERRLGIINSEQDQIRRLIEAQGLSFSSAMSSSLAGLFHMSLFPPGGHAFEAVAASLRGMSEYASNFAQRDASTAGYQRRRDDWIHQSNQALKELEQIDKQLIATDIRAAIAQKELDNTIKQIEQSSEVNEFMHSKFSNEQLYSWMESQLAGTYFRAYQLAYEVAKRAERGFAFDLNVENPQYIQFGYWDNLKKGLLAGERLLQGIKRMEVAYLDLHRRDYELTKHISISQLDPIALITLRATGQCEISLPEELFDMDGPGHYLRRIKSVALSILCVTGPYASVNCTLTLLGSSIRIRAGGNSSAGEGYARSFTNGVPDEDNRFDDDPLSASKSIVTSSGQNDSGLFETNLRDERYLPFEGAGVISKWRLQLPANPSEDEPCQFDYDTISDVILHLRYSALADESMRQTAVDSLKAKIKSTKGFGQVRLFSVRHDFPTEWAKFRNASPTNNGTHELVLRLKEEHYPFWSKGRLGTIQHAFLFADYKTTTPPERVIVDYGTADNNDSNDDHDSNTEEQNNDVLRASQPEQYGTLLSAELTKLPADSRETIGAFVVYLDDRNMDNLWLAVNWGKTNE